MRSKITEVYIDGLCESMRSICIGFPKTQISAKHRLSDILSEEGSSDDKLLQTHRNYLSDTENDNVPSTSRLSYKKVQGTSSSSKISKKKKKKSKEH